MNNIRTTKGLGIPEMLSKGNMTGASKAAGAFYDTAHHATTIGGVPSLDLTEGYSNPQINTLWKEKPLEWMAEAQENKSRRILDITKYDPSTKTLLDLGCGNGRLLRYIKDRYGGSASGITISKKQYEYCKKQKLGDVRECSFLDLSQVFPGQTFDIVTALGSLEHAVRLRDANRRKNIWRDTFESIRSVTKKGSPFVTTTIHFKEDYVPEAKSLDLSIWQILKLPDDDPRKIFGPICNQTLDCWYPLEYSDGNTEFIEATKGLFELKWSEDRTEDYRRTSVAWGLSYSQRLENPISWPPFLSAFVTHPKETFWASIDLFGEKRGLAFWTRQFTPQSRFNNKPPCVLRFDVWRAI